MHLKISQLLAEELRLLKTTLLASSMIPRAFCSSNFTPGYCWLDPATLRSLLILVAVVSLPHPYPLHPGHGFLPLTVLRPCQKAWLGLTPCPQNTGVPLSGSTAVSVGSCETQPCHPFPERAHPAETLGSTNPCIPVSSDCFGPCPHAAARLAKDCQHQILQNESTAFPHLQCFWY